MSHHSASCSCSQNDGAALPKGSDGGSAFSDSGSSAGDAEGLAHPQQRQCLTPTGGAQTRALYRGALRIELPFTASPPCTSPASPAEMTATTTHRSSPRTAVYRNSDGDAFAMGEGEECTPTSVVEHRARQSAMALLQADMASSRVHLSHSVGRESTRTTAPSLSLAVSGSFEMAEVPKKRAPLQNFFASRSRKQRSTLSSSSLAMGAGSSQRHPREISTALDLTSGADQDSHSHSHSLSHIVSTPRRGSHTSDPQLAQLLSASRMAGSVGSTDRQTSVAATNIAAAAAVMSLTLPPPPMPHAATDRAGAVPDAAVAPAASSTDDNDANDSYSNSAQTIGMEAVLRDASRVRGIRLTWLLYLLIVIVIVLFVLLLVQIIYESNNTLVRTATQAVRAQATSLANSLDVELYSLTNIFVQLRDLQIEHYNQSSLTYALVRDMFCARFYGAPMAYAMYNETGGVAWSMRCSLYPVAKGHRRLPPHVMPNVPQVQLTEYTTDAALVIRSYYSTENSTVRTYVILLDKDTLGRTMMGNSFPQYSSATLQYVMAGFITSMWNSTAPTLLFHTLTMSTPTYVSTQTGETHDAVLELYKGICYFGSPYLWHSVANYSMHLGPSDSDQPRANMRWPKMSMNEIPGPRLEFKRSWGQLSKASLCGVQCYGNAGGKECAEDNPTNIWFVAEYSLMGKNGLASILNVVGVVSIVALILFSFVLFLVYISITVPVNFLRVQLLKAVGANDTQSDFQRKMVRWTYRLWLGDLTAIVRSTHILSLCFRLNKRYVPDHVLRNHAQQLFLRRRKFNFLDDVDVKDGPSDREDTESEPDLAPPLAPLPGVSAVMPTSDSRFLWHFPSANDTDEPPSPQMQQQHTLTDPEAAGDGAGTTTSPTDAAVRPSTGAEVPPLAPPLAPPRSPMVDAHASAFAKRTKSTKRSATCANDSSIGAWPLGEVDVSPAEAGGDASLGASVLPNTRNLGTMAIRRDSESTILCVCIPSVELAYLMSYAAAVVQHRRVMRVLLHRIRRHKGALFHRSGDVLAAVWNAFEGCPNHAETAAVCAQEIANAFAPFRADGLHIGIVLHQGVLVCGSVEYSKAAFVTAFGEGPREAFALADLAASVSALNVVVTEPVKQTLSGLYDCNIVDVVQLPTSVHPLLLFELGGRRESVTSATPALRAQFAVEYARVFAHFRSHDFSGALQGIDHIRLSNGSGYNEHLLRRLERLCCFYATAPSALPLPYSRAFPAWANYEAVAQAGLRNDAHMRPQRANSLLFRTCLEGVVYAGLPAMRNDVEYIKDFKQELQENMRRTARRGNGSPTMDESSTRPHVTPQPSPPMRPAADPTFMSEPVLSVDSGMELLGETLGNTASVSPAGGSYTQPRSPYNGSGTNAVSNSCRGLPRPRHVDPVESSDMTAFELSAPLPTPVTAVPPLNGSATLPLLTFLTTKAVAAADHVTDHASLVGSSIQTMDSPRDVFALSNRFAATHRVTNRPPVALAAASPEMHDLTAERVVNGGGGTAHLGSFHSSGNHNNINDTATNSIIQSAGLSFRGSVNNNNVGPQGFSMQSGNLPSEITAKSGTTYLRSTRVLGKGSFGCVYLGMDAHSGRLVAIKFLPMPSDESGMEDIEAEVLILQRVNDTHVVQLLSYAFEGDTIVMIMECMLAGSLQNMISAFGSIPSSTSRVFMRDVLRGLSKIHSMGVIHRDVKPQNVLLSLAGNCKISDFGASAWLQELARKESQGQVCGTPVYLAPEAARGAPAKESDIWSCGIMFLQMITGALPYPQTNLSAGAAVLVFQIGSGIAQPRIPDTLDELDAEFVRACLHVDPSKRLTAAALLQLPIFTV